MADHILEMGRLGLCFMNNISQIRFLNMNPGNYFQGQKRLEVFNQLIFIPAYLELHCSKP